MPLDNLKSMLKKHGKEMSTDEIESKWEAAKKAADPEGKLKEPNWPVVMKIFKNMTGIKESEEKFDSLFEAVIRGFER